MPFGIGPLELIIVLVIALVIFGPKRLPDPGRSLATVSLGHWVWLRAAPSWGAS